MRTPIFFKDKVVLLKVSIDNKLTFEIQKENLRKKASRKFIYLRIREFLTGMQAKALASSFANSQINYYSAIWMFCSRKLNLRSESIHKKTLRVVFNEYEKNYNDLFADNDLYANQETFTVFSD